MKKVILIGGFLSLASFIFAQSGSKELRNAYSYYGQEYYDKAKIAIDKCIVFEDTKADAKTWMYRGNIYLMIESKKGTRDSVYYRKACDNCAEVAYDAYMQALKIDPEIEVSMNIKNPRAGLRYVSDLLVRDAYRAMQKQDLEQAYQLAKKAVKANDKNIDALHVLGRAAEILKKNDEAKANYREIVKTLPRDTSHIMYTYIYLANLYLNEGDYPNAVKTIETGVPFFLHDTCFKIDYAITYSIVMMGAGRSEDAEEIMAKALKKDPKNLTLLVNYGSQLNTAKFYDEAEVYFKRALEIAPNDMVVNYNLGNVYFNNFVDKYRNLNKIEDNTEYAKAKEEATATLMQARPYLEKAQELDPNDKNTLIMLRRLYMEAGEADKQKAVEEKLK